MTILGLDLAGLPKNPTGFASLSDHNFETGLIYSDEEIVELCRGRPALVAVDAPLSLPARGNLRQADKLLIKRGLRVFPPTFASMRKLTERGMRVASELRAMGIDVIEIHPRTSGKILFGTTLRRAWLSKLRRLGWRVKLGVSEHEADAVVAALTAWLHLKGATEEVGNAEEGKIVIPREPLRAFSGCRPSNKGSRRRRQMT